MAAKRRIEPNLYLQTQGDKSSWIFRYKLNGKQHEMGFGSTALVSRAQARKLALQYRLMLHEGRDPLAEKRAAFKGATFDELAVSYIENHKAGWKDGGKSAAQWESSLKTYVSPVIGAKPAGKITVTDVAAVLMPIWLDKAETARRVRGRIERILDAAAAAGHRSGDNPASLAILRHLLPAVRGAIRHHPAMAARDVPALIAELLANDSVSARALAWTILTASRTNETLGAAWSEIDADLWTIPKERMKAGRDHRIPLAPPVLALLRNWPRSGPLLFPGKKQAPLSNMAMLELIRGMRPGEGFTVHGFRSTFRDWSAAQGFAREACEAALAHTVAKGKAEAAYLRSDYLDARRPIMSRWSDFILPRPAQPVRPRRPRIRRSGWMVRG